MQDTRLKVGDRVKLVQKGSGIFEVHDPYAVIYAIVVRQDPFTVCFENNELERIGYSYSEDWFEKVEDTPTKDNVNSPAHYNHTKIECITYLEDTLGEGLTYYLEGNIKKYLHRWRYKNGIEDLKKAQWYLNKLIEAEEKK
jgi:hypothetical protein